MLNVPAALRAKLGPSVSMSAEGAEHAELAWEAALGARPAGTSVALAVARLQDPVMRRLYQEVDELEACLALHGERQIRECRMAVKCESDIMKAQVATEMKEAHDELQTLETKVALQEQAFKRNSRRLLDVQRQLKKKYQMPPKPDQMTAEREHEETCAAILDAEMAVQEEQESCHRILREELKQRDLAGPPCFHNSEWWLQG